MPAQATGYYTEPAVMTAARDYTPLLADLPRGVAALAGVAHGLLIHEHIAGDARLRVPATVYNAVLNRHEPVLP
jgi:hypothetical protein